MPYTSTNQWIPDNPVIPDWQSFQLRPGETKASLMADPARYSQYLSIVQTPSSIAPPEMRPVQNQLMGWGQQQGMNFGSQNGLMKGMDTLVTGATKLATIGGISAGVLGAAGYGPLAGGGGGTGSSVSYGGSGSLPATSGAPGTIQGTGLAGKFGVGALTAQTPTVGALSTGVPLATSVPTASMLGGIASNPWIGALGSLGAAGIGAYAANKAAQTQSDAANKAADTSMAQYEQTRADLAPWRQAGVDALAKIQAGNFQMDPGYQFRQSEGEKGINRSAAGRSSFDSGATLKALNRYNQDYATNEWGNVYNRLAGLAGVGQTATTQTGTFGAGATNQANDYLTSGAAARGAGSVGVANAITGGLGNAYNNYNQSKLLNWWTNQPRYA